MKTVLVADQERPLVWIERRYPRETPRAFGEPLFEYEWLPHGFRRRREGELCDVCSWPVCAPWHPVARSIGPVRALVFGWFCAAAGVVLTLAYLRGGL